MRAWNNINLPDTTNWLPLLALGGKWMVVLLNQTPEKEPLFIQPQVSMLQYLSTKYISPF